jgi:predicted ATPase/transcriptional regulator with XRE-family HTH domain
VAASPPDFGSIIRRCRLSIGLSQEELAERSSVSARAISDMERGLRKSPRPETLRLLADALALDADERALFFTSAQAMPGDSAQSRQGDVSGRSGTSTALPFTIRPLPLPLDTLIGREDNIEAIVSLLESEPVRLVTLTGPGGVGKTRLGLAVGARIAPDFVEGAAFVDLAPLSTADQVAPAILASLGLSSDPRTAPRDALRGALQSRHLLLVLDNFEHLLDEGPLLSDLLVDSSALKILVTSRVRLRLRGEHVYSVEPLPVPPVIEEPDGRLASDLLLNPSVQLFHDRARQADYDFVLDHQNADDIAKVCRHLDGLPLAMELVAARVRGFPPAALLTRLNRRLPLLTGGGRDLPARHQTMRDAIAWSYDLLTIEEQGLFRRLAVFTGGFTLEAAQAVAGEGEAARDVLDIVMSLLDTSLLRPAEGIDGEPRFGMLETIREYALELLVASGEAPTVRASHATHFLALVEHTRPLLEGPERLARLDRLEEEYPNLRGALEWATEAPDAEMALRLTGGLWTFWMARMPSGEGQRWVEAALALGGQAAARLDALYGSFVLAYIQGDHQTAIARAEELLGTATLAADATGIARAHIALGIAAKLRADRNEQRRHFGEALARFRALDDPSWLALALNNCGEVALSDGDRKWARALQEEALAVYRAIGMEWGIALALFDLGDVAFAEGDYARAATLLAESLARSWAQRDRWRAAVTLTVLACLAAEAIMPEPAARLLGAAEHLGELAGAAVLPGLRVDYDGAVGRTRDALGQSAFRAAWSDGRSLLADRAVAEAVAIGEEIGRNSVKGSPAAEQAAGHGLLAAGEAGIEA